MKVKRIRLSYGKRLHPDYMGCECCGRSIIEHGLAEVPIYYRIDGEVFCVNCAYDPVNNLLVNNK